MSAVQTRQKAHLPASAYSLTIYLAYIFYPPLYLAGPILTFNSFASQVRQPMLQKPKQVSLQQTLSDMVHAGAKVANKLNSWHSPSML